MSESLTDDELDKAAARYAGGSPDGRCLFSTALHVADPHGARVRCGRPVVHESPHRLEGGECAGDGIGNASDPAGLALVDEVRRLRAENADLAEQLRREMEAYAAQAYRQDCRGEGTCSLGITDGRECRRHTLEALDRRHTRADRYAAALAHIESLGQHAEGCLVVDAAPGEPVEWRCDPACPTATAKRAREGT